MTGTYDEITGRLEARNNWIPLLSLSLSLYFPHLSVSQPLTRPFLFDSSSLIFLLSFRSPLFRLIASFIFSPCINRRCFIEPFELTPPSCSLALFPLRSLSLSETIAILHEPLAFTQSNTYDMLIIQYSPARSENKRLPGGSALNPPKQNVELKKKTFEGKNNFQPLLFVFSYYGPQEGVNKIPP